MTTKYMKTNGINLYKMNGEAYCKLIDVCKLISHELSENEYFGAKDETISDMLDRMQMRVTKNDFILKDAKKPIDLNANEKEEEEEVPGRYAVGRKKDNEWEFIAGNIGEVPLMTRKPHVAQLFKAYRDASAYADFLDEDGWVVLDWEENMTEEDRWVRELRMPFPYDLDDGFENSVPFVVEK